MQGKRRIAAQFEVIKDMKRKNITAIITASIAAISILGGCSTDAARTNENKPGTAADAATAENSGTLADSATIETSATGTDSALAEISNTETSSASSSTSTEEKSIFGIWEYEGYVDECSQYYWQEDFQNCDYDGDGKVDRLARSLVADTDLAIYTIEFGNGDKLVTPGGWYTGFPHIQSGDLDGDGAKEILVTLTYDTSTDPFSFGDMWLFDREQTSGEYVEVELPMVKAENGGKGFNVDYDKSGNKINYTLREAGFSGTEEVDDDYLSSWWTEGLTTQLRPAFYAEIIDGDKPVLRCYIVPIHRWGPSLGFDLNYMDGQYQIGDFENDSPHTWGI